MSTGAEARESRPPKRRPRIRMGAVIALAIAAGVAAWLYVRDDDSASSEPTTTAAATGPNPPPSATSQVKEASVAQLRALANSVGHPVYWIGRQQGAKYELTQTSDGKIYIRYLPKGQAIRVRRPYLTIATYPFERALPALKAVAAEENREPIELRGGGIALVTRGYPQSVHVAYPGVDYQVELFDPSAQRARRIVVANRIEPLP